MGPRSHERGNWSIANGASSHSVLQWGRVLMNAETFFLAADAPTAAKLQWGRVLMNAETGRRDGEQSDGRSGFNGAAFS